VQRVVLELDWRDGRAREIELYVGSSNLDAWGGATNEADESTGRHGGAFLHDLCR